MLGSPAVAVAQIAIGGGTSSRARVAISAIASAVPKPAEVGGVEGEVDRRGRAARRRRRPARGCGRRVHAAQAKRTAKPR